jgi:aspartate/methionine/tyrosine aminotransferase
MQFAQLARTHKIALIVDETYRDLLEADTKPHSIFTPGNGWDWRSTFVHLFSFSKSYCLPGHRLGAVVAAPELQNHVKTVLDCMQVNSFRFGTEVYRNA